MAYMGFTWQGRNSADYGLALSALPVISMPASRYSVTNIPGRNDTIFKREGFADYTVELSLVYVGEHSDFRSAMNTFFYKDPTSSVNKNKLILPTEVDYVYDAYLFEKIDFEKFHQYKTTTVSFTVQPLKEYADSYVIDTALSPTHRLDIPVWQRKSIIGRKPRFVVECDLANVTGTKISIAFATLTIDGNSYTRVYVISLPTLKSYAGNKPIVVFDFESDEYYVCRTLSVDFSKNAVETYCKPEQAVSSLVPLLFLNDCADYVGENSEAMSLWKNVEFCDTYDTVDAGGNGETPLYNCKVYEEFRVKAL